MAFDAGLLRAVVNEIKEKVCGCRVEKIYQPQNDEIDLQLRGREGTFRLLLRCGASDTRIQLTSLFRDNPQTPPTFCMLLRKHLQGAVLENVRQIGFERVAFLDFLCRDEMGYDCHRHLVAEVMGRNSNLIYIDDNGKILAAMRIVDFSTSRLRQILPGMKYELPPVQEDKSDPRDADSEKIQSMLEASPDRQASKALTDVFVGISPAVAREAVYRACGNTEAVCSDVEPHALYKALQGMLSGDNRPCLVTNGQKYAEYSFVPLTQYGSDTIRICDSFGQMLDLYFGERDRASITGNRAQDLKQSISSAISRLSRKINIQHSELADCDKEDEYKTAGDLIVANIYRLKKGDTSVRLTDYSEMNDDGTFKEKTLTLDPLLNPSANAQKFFKKYAKCRKARIELTKQLEIAENELNYLRTVEDALGRAETGAEIAGIRYELEKTGYIREKKGAAPAKSVKSQPVVYMTSGGYTVLCGRNNIQNDELTFKIADKYDIWFHSKGIPGSHVVLRTNGEPVPDEDMTEAAQIAALNSDGAGGINVAVDYTTVKNIKKPQGAKPGFVIYHTNQTAYVTPNREIIEAKRVRK